MIKWILGLLGLIYVVSPYDLIPDFMVLRGWLDDLVVLYLIYRYYLKPFLSARGPGRAEERQQQRGSSRGQTRPSHQDSGPRDPFQVLGVAPGASAEEIRRAYLALAAKYHPDKVQHLGEDFQRLAEQRFKEIQAAYQALSRKGA
jgi:hypothetical protein